MWFRFQVRMIDVQEAAGADSYELAICYAAPHRPVGYRTKREAPGNTPGAKGMRRGQLTIGTEAFKGPTLLEPDGTCSRTRPTVQTHKSARRGRNLDGCSTARPTTIADGLLARVGERQSPDGPKISVLKFQESARLASFRQAAWARIRNQESRMRRRSS
ncbi:hypothetical protein BO70DRAFT_36683 [Aspergillus heteromorphus CBS 117.55]|uniref:Uncharacterized protein n=1 Tax=Aspergillus heteromorphus CBS 117.55 TaxID=1448321 RepID=A0A317WB13_9EURO|nr:uncharacterized protein BO70DRAFT_36683 [Aspergillus heteromorphus CBS 117.55]PWY82208.1 hypothetical protein BO70DRAFT_36683 [Aspergillus heteromorphus CBS 117.55]